MSTDKNTVKDTRLDFQQELIEIEKVEINVGKKEVVEASNITDKEKQEIIEYLAEEYSIDKTQIIIN